MMTFKYKTSFLFLFILTLCGIAIAHPIHLSLTEIQYNEESKALQVIHKIFIDDLEDAIEKNYKLKLRLHTEKEHPESEKYVRLYIENTFQVAINSKPLVFNWVGMETDMEALWAYQEAEKIKKIHSIKIHDRILLELFNDQKNMVHVFYRAMKKTLLFDEDDPVQSVELN